MEHAGSINSDPSTADVLTSELKEYERQFAAINKDAKALLGDLSERQLEWREDVTHWSISDCVNHLVVIGNQSLSRIRRAIVAARSKGMLGAGPFRHPVTAFWTLQNELAHALREANGVDLARVRVTNPVCHWFKMTLGQEFALTAAHERRHLWQAWRVRQKKLLSIGAAG